MKPEMEVADLLHDNWCRIVTLIHAKEGRQAKVIFDEHARAAFNAGLDAGFARGVEAAAEYFDGRIKELRTLRDGHIPHSRPWRELHNKAETLDDDVRRVRRTLRREPGGAESPGERSE